MKLPSALLDAVRGTAVVAAVTSTAACTPAAPVPPVDLSPEPAAAVLRVPAPAPVDPVAYDRGAEHERLLRADASGWAEARRRDRRVADQADALQRQRQRQQQVQLISLPRHHGIACGRG
jgi:hypothetical protein